MNCEDPTTPLDGLPSHDLPTINRPASSPAPTPDGFAPGTIVAARAIEWSHSSGAAAWAPFVVPMICDSDNRFTGQRVYSSSSFAERRQQRVVVPRPPTGSIKEIDPAIDALITACLAEDPSQRPASARAVLAMLPGGDAIDAAVAAGETPSPEMIAAAAETGHLSSGVAWSCVAAIVALLLLFTWQQRASVVTLMRKPPEVFVDRAAEIVAQAGEASPAVDETYFFDSDRALLPSLVRVDARFGNVTNVLLRLTAHTPLVPMTRLARRDPGVPSRRRR